VDHGIPTGEEVEVTHVGYKSVIAHYASGRYIHENDYEVVPQDKTLELIANLSAEVTRLNHRISALESAEKKPIKVSVKIGDDTPYNFTVMRGGANA
jgi:hypothetical protein